MSERDWVLLYVVLKYCDNYVTNMLNIDLASSYNQQWLVHRQYYWLVANGL